MAYLEELKKMDASEIYPRRVNVKEVLVSEKGEEICISKNIWYSKIFKEKTTYSGNPLSGGNEPYGVKIPVESFTANRESLNRQHQQWTLKPEKTCGMSSFIVITQNLVFNSMCRRKSHVLFDGRELT